MIPTTRFDSLDLILETLASFWQRIYAGRELVTDIFRAATLQERQIQQREAEFDGTVSRQDCSTTSAWRWYPVTLNRDDMVDADYSGNSGEAFSDETGYGQIMDSSVAFPAPEGLISAAGVSDYIAAPTVWLSNNVEMTISNGKIVFVNDPFKDTRFTAEDVDGQTILRLNLFNAEFDSSAFVAAWSDAAGLSGDASEQYKNLSNALLDARTFGASFKFILDAVEAITGIPLAKGTEIVEQIGETDAYKYVITDQNAYRFPLTATVVVAVDQTLQLGESLVDSVYVYRTRPAADLPDWLTSITVGPGYGLAKEIDDTLEFLNQDVPITVSTAAGFTKIEFTLTGDSGTVDDFFDSLHARGVAASETVAMLLDRRTNPIGQPSAEDLPATVNPAKILLNELLGGCAIVIQIDTAKVDLEVFNAGLLSVCQSLVPPHTLLLTNLI